VKAYAYIYKVKADNVNGIKLSDMSISFVSSRYPRDLVKHLEEEKGFKVHLKSEGIYYIEKDDIKTQIVVIDELPKRVNKYVRVLTKKLKEIDEAIEIIEEYDQNTKNTEIEIIADFIGKRHIDVIMEVFEMGVALKLTEEQKERLSAIAEKAGLMKGKYEDGKIEGKIEAARNLLISGVDLEIVIKCTGLDRELVMSIYDEVKNEEV
jgi:predicted transposase/invertase (TIGR01784 family)